MNIESHKTENITWDIDGCTATATVSAESGKGIEITGVNIGLSADLENNRIISNDEQFIRDVHKALGQLIAHVDKERGLGRTDKSWSVFHPDKSPVNEVEKIIACYCEEEEAENCYATCDQKLVGGTKTVSSDNISAINTNEEGEES